MRHIPVEAYIKYRRLSDYLVEFYGAVLYLRDKVHNKTISDIRAGLLNDMHARDLSKNGGSINIPQG